MKLSPKYCDGCKYKMTPGFCAVPPGRPRTMATIRLCHRAGWRVKRQRAARSRRSSAPTGRWAETLKDR